MINTTNFNFGKYRNEEVTDTPNTVKEDLEFEVWSTLTYIELLNLPVKKIAYGRKYL